MPNMLVLENDTNLSLNFYNQITLSNSLKFFIMSNLDFELLFLSSVILYRLNSMYQ